MLAVLLYRLIARVAQCVGLTETLNAKMISEGKRKAAIILAGSILEAVLIDWLSEIKGINYFEKEYHGENNEKKKCSLERLY